MEKILILGLNSFSGSTFANFIQKKKIYKLYGVYHKKKNKKYILYNQSKITKRKIDNLEHKKIIQFIKKVKPSIIVDFASICMVNESWKFRKYYNDVNYLSKIKLTNFLKNSAYLKKYIYISTPEIFGSSNKIDEDSTNFKPSTPYALSKLKAEKLFLKLYKKYSFPIIICRFSNFYGPGQPIYRLIPKTCVMLDNKLQFPLHGNGNTKRNFIFSDDFCDGIYSSIKKGIIGKKYHFSSDEIISIKEIVKRICRIKKKKFDTYVKLVKERKNKDKIYKLQSQKTKKSLKWNSKTSFNKGLKKTIQFYKKYFNHLKNEKNDYVFQK